MKNKILVLALSLLFITPIAQADVYVKVDASGNAIGGAIMCDSGTCGAGSQYSQLTLQAGEQYVLQGTGQAGIGNNNPNTQVKVDIATNEWTVTRQNTITPAEPVVINNQQVISYTVQTVETFTPATSPGNDRPAPVAPVIEPTPTPSPTVATTPTITPGSVATATATTLTVGSLKSTFAIKPVVKKSTVIMATKNGVKVIKKEDAKALIRKKKK
jgi:hypothetical protein